MFLLKIPHVLPSLAPQWFICETFICFVLHSWCCDELLSTEGSWSVIVFLSQHCLWQFTSTNQYSHPQCLTITLFRPYPDYQKFHCTSSLVVTNCHGDAFYIWYVGVLSRVCACVCKCVCAHVSLEADNLLCVSPKMQVQQASSLNCSGILVTC